MRMWGPGQGLRVTAGMDWCLCPGPSEIPHFQHQHTGVTAATAAIASAIVLDAGACRIGPHRFVWQRGADALPAPARGCRLARAVRLLAIRALMQGPHPILHLYFRAGPLGQATHDRLLAGPPPSSPCTGAVQAGVCGD